MSHSLHYHRLLSQVGKTASPTQSPSEPLEVEATPKTEPDPDANPDSSVTNQPILQGVVQGRSGVLFFTRERKTTPPALRRPASVPGVLRYVNRGHMYDVPMKWV